MVDPELVAIGAETPARLTDLGVMPEPGGEGEEPQPDAGAQARECAGAVALEAELSLAGPKDRFDPLAHAPERSEAERLVLAIGMKNSAPRSAIQPSNSAPAKPLSAMTVNHRLRRTRNDPPAAITSSTSRCVTDTLA